MSAPPPSCLLAGTSIMSHLAHRLPNLACRHGRARGLLRWLYTSNPFYVLSADLVFVGLRMSLDTSGKTFETWALMLSLLGYTLLLATTACLLIRLGNVWDDVRTLLLLVVAMFLAISVTFDETLAGNPRLGKACSTSAGCCSPSPSARACSGGSGSGSRRCSGCPYYLILSPLLPLPGRPHPAPGRPGQPGAPVDALRLLAAGGARVPQPRSRRSGGDRATSPRTGARGGTRSTPGCSSGCWPRRSAGGRSTSASRSTSSACRAPSGGPTASSAPTSWCRSCSRWTSCSLEAGVVSRNRATQRAALVALPGLLVLALIGHRPDPVYPGLPGHCSWSGLGGSPLFLTLIAVAALYGFAAARRVPLALGG